MNERGVRVRSVPFDVQSGELAWDALERAITPKTRLVAIGAASNALGTVTAVRDAARLAHSVGALCFVDAVHFAPHNVVDVQAMECDFLVCSPYKFYGPHAGVLFARAEIMAGLPVAKVLPASNEIPERVETGTQNHEGIAGSAAAVNFLASLAPGRTRRERLIRAMSGLHERGEALFGRLWTALSGLGGVTCFGPPPGRPRTPTLAFTIAGIPSSEVAKALARDALFVSNGNFYASSVVERLGLAPQGLVRIGCACYTTEQEIERLIGSIRRIADQGSRKSEIRNPKSETNPNCGGKGK
jgi:selenocysteine lyase/cysteine desulfurase